MDRKSLEKLGYFEVMEAVAHHTSLPAAQALVRSARPMTDAAALHEEAALVGEAMDCLQRGLDLPAAGAIDADFLLGVLRQAHSTFTAADAAQLAALCEAAEEFRAFRRRGAKSAFRLAELCGAMPPLAELRRRIEEVIGPDGRVRDDASPDLQRIRRQIAARERERQTAIERLTRRLFDVGRLRDNYYSIRGEDRFVVPVKAGEHNRVAGILHDVSQSGETYFIEPAEMVALTNELMSLRAREEVETIKVLKALTSDARSQLPALEKAAALLARLEASFARARFGESHGWKLCAAGRDGGVLDLRDCHHPLLAMRRPEQSQPNSLALRPEDRAVVISGPNAGGKTTLLKMTGLVAALAQSAMPLPMSPDSHVPLFRAIFADIGDEQDISTGTSSFSAHVRQLSRIIREAHEAALVLLDEIGGSTDPEEGAALAAGVLETLAAQGALTLATSHYTVLKDWAHNTPFARNVSFYLDAATHKPTFHLMMDVPGVSEAFVVAREEGLPEEVLRRAERHIEPERRQLAELLVEVQRKDAQLRRLQQDNEQMMAALERERAEVKVLQKELEREKRIYRAELLRDKEAELRQMRADLEQIIARQPSRQTLERARRALAAVQKETARERQRVEDVQVRFVAAGRLKPGMRLKIREMSDPVELVSLDHKKARALVRAGTLSMTVRFDDIEGEVKPPRAEEKEKAGGAGTGSTSGARPSGFSIHKARENVPLELDLHGRRVEEALELVDRYLNDALLANLPYARILHGIGTGALRNAIREFLKTHPLVKSWRAGTAEEGGIGSTTVYFK
ncbi:MAG: endonuclease MutS2 [Candidatus Sumerlaeia bacterium]